MKKFKNMRSFAGTRKTQRVQDFLTWSQGAVKFD